MGLSGDGCAVGRGGASRAQLGVRPWLGATPPSRAATLQISASPTRVSASRHVAAAPRSPLAARTPPWAHATARTALCKITVISVVNGHVPHS